MADPESMRQLGPFGAVLGEMYEHTSMFDWDGTGVKMALGVMRTHRYVTYEVSER